MQITPVDQDHNLFEISNLIPQPLVDKVLQTPWIDLTYSLEDGNRELRRRIHNDQLPWINEWHDCIRKQWDNIVQQTGCDHLTYSDTGFWIDEATYTCPIHTDGELPGAIQLYWVGESKDTGTTWYRYRGHPDKIRHSCKFITNTGYMMINKPEPNGYRKLQWHGMLTPVPDNSIRVSSYSWLTIK
jgi:hypothetical protein